MAKNNNDSKAVDRAEETPKGPLKSTLREYFESAVVTLIMALYGMTFVAQGVDVPTGSMQNTILIGDHLLVNKFIFAPGPHLPFLPQRDVQRGDIVVFKWPGDVNHPEYNREPDNIPYRTFYVKRVVGMPGDKIELRGAQVLINDQPLSEHRIAAIDHGDKSPDQIVNEPPRQANEKYNVYYKPSTIQLTPPHPIDSEAITYHYAKAGQPMIIPPGYYFVMGDNRDNSLDSRYWGLLRRDLIFGRPMIVYWSYDQSAPKSNFLIDFFKNSRWGRTGTLIK